jgi:hypothetical protein
MSSTTFSGPVKAGTIKDTTGSTVGTNVANVGFALMAQSAVIGIAGVTWVNQVVATIPANSQIVDAILNVTTANDDGTASTVAVGTSADADALSQLQVFRLWELLAVPWIQKQLMLELPTYRF